MRAVALVNLTPGAHIHHDGQEKLNKPMTVTSTEPTIGGGAQVIVNVARGTGDSKVTGSWVGHKDHQVWVSE